MHWSTCWDQDPSFNPTKYRGWELRKVRRPQEARRLGLHVTSSSELTLNPTKSAADTLANLPNGPLAVHLDVDVLDFIDTPLAENADGRNSGPTLDQVALALEIAVRDERFRAISIGELNPTRSAGDPEVIRRFARTIANVITSAHC